MAMSHPATTVMGIPLHPGERVIHFVKPDLSVTKTLQLIMGILFLVVLFGIFLLIARSRVDKNNPRAMIVTTHRLIVIEGTGNIVEFPLRQIADVSAVRHSSSMLADRRPKSDINYWRGGPAIGINVRDAQGNTTPVFCKDRPDAVWQTGRFLAAGLERGFEAFPSVPAPPNAV